MSEELKPCPFCQGIASLDEWSEGDAHEWRAQVICRSCDAKSGEGRAGNRLGCYDAENGVHRDQAVSLWNTRATPAPAQPDPLHVANERGEEAKDAARYRRFFDAGLPITFMGVEYEDKASLDAAIDADLAQEGKT